MAKVLITQHASLSLKAAYASLGENYGVQVDFQGFSEPKFISLPEFRTNKDLILTRSAFLFSNSTAINAFLKMCNRCSIFLHPDKIKYFLAREGLQKHLQKYVELKKRKLFCGQRGLEDLFPIMPKHKNNRFLFASSDVGNSVVRDFFKKEGYDYAELVLYRNEVPDLSHLHLEGYDVIVFFSPVTIRSFHQCFPTYDFSQTKVAVLGEKAVEEANKLGWPLHIVVPALGVNSMLDGLENYFESVG
ncbi:MAG: uroporphyrinogen-III synthase [Cytophagales bacterium]